MSGHAIAAAAAGSQGLWLVSRASGVVLLILFSVVMVLGVSTRTGAASRRWPRFAVAELHRTLSLFAVALLGLHVATALLDPYVSISWFASVLPFTSHYETLAIGAGTVAVDIGGAVLITSLLRKRIGRRAWRAVHYLAYLAWPVAFVHAITAASYDQHLWWVVASEWGSLAAVATAVIVRLVKRGRPGPVDEPPAARSLRPRSPGLSASRRHVREEASS
jgi:predicted ferric reductase